MHEDLQWTQSVRDGAERTRNGARCRAGRAPSPSPIGWGLIGALLASVVTLAPGPVRGEEPAVAALSRPAQARGTAVVPERFLRPWDPVTIFFPRDVGPREGGPTLDPGKGISLEPSHPGAWTWLDARTLRFQPADPWPPFARFTVNAGGSSTRLATLLATPRSTLPADGAGGLDPVEAITMTFDEPLDAEGLARATTLELRPLPGIGGERSRTLDQQDFTIKVLERARTSDPAIYVVGLKQPISWGTQVRVRMRLSPDDEPGSGSDILSFATAAPFRPVAFGCRSARFPVSPGGAVYTGEQALRCDDEQPAVVVDLSSEPDGVDPTQARNLVRLDPSVPGLDVVLAGRRIELRGAFRRDTRYRVTLDPTGAELRDARGRTLELEGRNELVLFFPARPPWLRWEEAEGIVERFGPQMVPLAGRGDERVDVRIHRVDPLDRSFWPFPYEPVEVDEETRPPGPGEEPAAWAPQLDRIGVDELARRLKVLGSPAASRLLPLPLRRQGASATFGLDLGPLLRDVSGPKAPGSYLVGLRRLDGSTTRSWMRVQVTDLALSTFEEPRRTVFFVTSLQTGEPVAGAEVRIEGWSTPRRSERYWALLYKGTTGPDGRLAWSVPGYEGQRTVQVGRIVVSRGDDTLVLDPERSPDAYRENAWSESWATWLQWTHQHLQGREERPQNLAHLFTERPVSRPEEPVHLKAYVRRRSGGVYEPVVGRAVLVVDGPGDLEWRWQHDLTEHGSLYQRFEEADLPTGVYRAWLEVPDWGRSEEITFRKEAYRLPRFEVRLDGPGRSPLDRPFEVDLLATYYAGGRVSERPVRWRVTQFPHRWTPQGREGFVFSSDARFSGDRPFQSAGLRETTTTTDADGSATLELDPSTEPTAQPRIYVVEATVTGADDQTVTATRRVVAVPPFVLGLRLERYLRSADAVRPEVLVLGPDDAAIAGQEVTVRLLHRQWHSVLRASDFTDGEARYVTDVVDEKLAERTLTSGEEPLALELPLRGAGVYLVELESRDRLGRAQVVRADVFVEGPEAIAWERPKAGVFEIATDRSSYRPGQTAQFVLQSPFQQAEAVAVVETPTGNRYHRVAVRGGRGTFELPVDGTWSPRIPVHFLLRRGRIEGTEPRPGSSTDLGKPTTLAATRWLTVEAVDQTVAVTLKHPERALPGQEVEVEVRLADPEGRPLAGEVTLWLVDRAVLALGKEQRLDPLPDFMRPIAARLEIRDTRGLVFGKIPFAESSGGGIGGEDQGLLDRQTVRENFDPVPFYDARILVGSDGVVRVPVKLSDDLTTFALRAKAVSGQRFGFAKSRIDVRLPVIVQPALPRFVRPGDTFQASAVARVVEGEGGPGRVQASFEGLEAEAATEGPVTLRVGEPTRARIPVRVPTPEVGGDGRPLRDEVTVSFGVERASDGAGDAFAVTLPLRDDRRLRRRSEIRILEPGDVFEMPALGEPVRPGSAATSILLSERPAIVAMAGGLDFLLRYPYGCTEQRIARSRAQLAMRRFRDAFALEGDDEALDRAVETTLEWVALAETSSGRIAYWPGSGGSVMLTAWVVEWMVEVREAGYAIDEELFARQVRALEGSLRSDSTGLVEGWKWFERVWALRALAAAGEFDEAYGAELSRRARSLDQESLAGVLLAFDRAGLGATPTLEPLTEELWDGLVLRSHQGRDIFGGLADRSGVAPLDLRLLPSQSRTLAETIRALRRRAASDERLEVLLEGLVALGQGDGWGSTNANAFALLALAETLEEGGRTTTQRAVEMRLGSEPESTWTVGGGQPAVRVTSTSTGDAVLRLGADAPEPVAVRVDRRWIPAPPGSEAPSTREGFVVERGFERVGGGTKPRVLEEPGSVISLAVGDVVEEHLRVINPVDRYYVAIVAPLAAGLEVLNPALETAPPEAQPAGRTTVEPSWTAMLDDQVLWAFDALPAGTHDLYFRTRASIEGRFVQPPALAEDMYDASVVGTSPGAWVEVEAAPEEVAAP